MQTALLLVSLILRGKRMRLRKCTDISMRFPEYFEIVQNNQTVLDIHQNSTKAVEVSIGEYIFEFEEFIALLVQAKSSLLNRKEDI